MVSPAISASKTVCIGSSVSLKRTLYLVLYIQCDNIVDPPQTIVYLMIFTHFVSAKNPQVLHARGSVYLHVRYVFGH